MSKRTMTIQTPIEAHALVKTFGNVRALNGLDLNIASGEVHGFLGPNGAGKTTTIRILLGLLRANSGTARIFGRDCWSDAVQLHRRLAYVPGDVVLWPNLSGGEVIDLLGRLRGGINANRKSHLLKQFDLDPTRKCKTYSKGNRQKVAIIAALASDVDLYIFDEPTSGLDPLMQVTFNDCVAEARAARKTVLLSSHVLAEVQVLCDRVSIVRRGKLIETGTLRELRHLTRTTLTVETRKPVTGLDSMSGVHDLVVSGLQMKCRVESADLDPVMRHIAQFGIVALTSEPPTLEELFMRHYGSDEVLQRSAVG